MLLITDLLTSITIKSDDTATSTEPTYETSYIDTIGYDKNPGSNVGSLTGATAVTAVATLSSEAISREIVGINVYNADSVTRTITVYKKKSNTSYPLCAVALASGDSLIYVDGEWKRVSGSIPTGTGKQYIQGVLGAKAGTTSGWTVNAGNNIATCTVAASQTAATLVVPITADLKVGNTITAFSLSGAITSGGQTVTLDAQLRKQTAASGSITDSLVASMTQISKTAAYLISDSKASLTEAVVAETSYYLLLTATTGSGATILLSGVSITLTEI